MKTLSACVWQCYGSGLNGCFAALWCGAVVLKAWSAVASPATGLGAFRFPKRLLQCCQKNINVHGNHCLKGLSLRGANNPTYTPELALLVVKIFSPSVTNANCWEKYCWEELVELKRWWQTAAFPGVLTASLFSAALAPLLCLC